MNLPGIGMANLVTLGKASGLTYVTRHMIAPKEESEVNFLRPFQGAFYTLTYIALL